jgi:hypothetical protein
MNRYSVAAAWLAGGVVWGVALVALCLVARTAPPGGEVLSGRLAEPQVARMLEQEHQWMSAALPPRPTPLDADDEVTTAVGSAHPHSAPGA